MCVCVCVCVCVIYTEFLPLWFKENTMCVTISRFAILNESMLLNTNAVNFTTFDSFPQLSSFCLLINILR